MWIRTSCGGLVQAVLQELLEASQAVPVAIGTVGSNPRARDGRRSILAVGLAHMREPLELARVPRGAARGLAGVEFVVSDDHAGLRPAIVELLPEAACNAVTGMSCASRWITCRAGTTTTACASCAGFHDRRHLGEARRDLAAWLAKWQATYPKLCGWVEEHIEATLTFYRLPRRQHEQLKSTNLLERLNEEIKRATWSGSSRTRQAVCA